MSTPINKVYASNLFIPDCNKIEILRLMPKSAGFDIYLPRSIVQFLGLDRESKSLVAFLDDTGSRNFLVIVSDKDLVEMLKPIILERRRRAEEMKQQLKSQLQPQERVKQNDFVVDTEVEK